MAIAVQWATVASVATSSGSVYTIPGPSTTTSYGSYARDLVVTNSGSATIFVSLGAGSTGASTIASFQIPSGGTVLLTQCQVPQGAIMYAIGSAASQVSVGYATNVAYI